MISRHAVRACCVALVTLALVPGCANQPHTPPPADVSLYNDLGGEPGITAIIDQFLWNLAEDERIGAHFAETNIARFRAKLIEQFCMVSGGPCEYTGDDMARTHAGLDINDAHFNALVEDLIEAMEALDVGTGAQNRLLAQLAPMHHDITGH